MKIEIELDEKKVFEEVVSRLTAVLQYEGKIQTERALKEGIVAEVVKASRSYADELLKTLTLSDGRSFRQYVEDLLNTAKGKDHWERSRMRSIVDERIYNEAHHLFEDIAKPHLDDLKNGIVKLLLAKLQAA